MAVDNEEMTRTLNEIVDNAKNIAEFIMCGYRAMHKEMIDAGAPRPLADEAAYAHAQRLIEEIRKARQA